MPIFAKWTFAKSDLRSWSYPNYWDAIALCLVMAFLVLLGWGAKGMATPYHLGQQIPIYLDPTYLPYYAFRSILRMALALVCSTVFTLIVGTAAAKSTHAERVLIPLIDILQSVPVLGYLSITVVTFIAIFPNSLLGPECAAIFAIFTAQVWNMTLSFYQSVRTVPTDLQEASAMFHLTAWQRFWRLEVPFAMPGLLWNAMMSMSASWFFVVASEAISVNHQNITLPGIGSYIAVAVQHADIRSVGYAIIAMFVVILLYDQILFRPLSEWISKFKFEQENEEVQTNALILRLFQNTHWFHKCSEYVLSVWNHFVNLPVWLRKAKLARQKIVAPHLVWHKYAIVSWYVVLIASLLVAALVLLHFVFTAVTWREAEQVLYLGAITAFKVMVLIIFCSLIWIPLGVWIGMRPRVANAVQPVIQFLASFPVNLVYPVVVLMIMDFHLNANIWTSPLMILGAQWYIAFNVIAGARILPQDLHQAAGSLNVRGWLWWRRFILPGIFPYFVTGAISAAGGAWNASIIAEVVVWGHTQIVATGLGAYISNQTTSGDFPRLTLGIAVMCVFVLGINRLIWRPLYNLATERFKVA